MLYKPWWLGGLSKVGLGNAADSLDMRGHLLGGNNPPSPGLAPCPILINMPAGSVTICGMALMMRFQPKWPEAIWMMKYFKYSEVSRRIGMPPSPEFIRTGIPHCSFRYATAKARASHMRQESAPMTYPDHDWINPLHGRGLALHDQFAVFDLERVIPWQAGCGPTASADRRYAGRHPARGRSSG